MAETLVAILTLSARWTLLDCLVCGVLLSNLLVGRLCFLWTLEATWYRLWYGVLVLKVLQDRQ